MERNWYHIMGLPESSDGEAVRRKYRQLAKKYHPDRFGQDRVPFQDIQEAYTILGDREKKQAYDAALASGSTEKPGLKAEVRTRSQGRIPVEPLCDLWSEERNFRIPVEPLRGLRFHEKLMTSPVEPLRGGLRKQQTGPRFSGQELVQALTGRSIWRFLDTSEWF